MNTYAYVSGNPIMFVDPLGLLEQCTVNFIAGIGDAMLLGFGDELRSLLGVGGVNTSSDAYSYGSYTGAAVLGGGRLAYAGVVKGYSMLAPSGQAASSFRSSMKTLFRGGQGRNWRPVDLSKYQTDAALRAAAGRTHKGVNAYGAGVAAAGVGAGADNGGDNQNCGFN